MKGLRLRAPQLVQVCKRAQFGLMTRAPPTNVQRPPSRDCPLLLPPSPAPPGAAPPPPPAIFEAVGASTDALYSAPEAFEVAQAYVRAAKLEEGAPDTRSLLLDAPLCDGLFKGLVKKGETFPTTLPKVMRAALRRPRPRVRARAQARGGPACLASGVQNC